MATAAVQARQQAGKIFAGEHHQTKCQIAIEMRDDLAQWGYRTPVVAADAGFGDTTAFRLALTERNIECVAAVNGSTGAYTAAAVAVTAHRQNPAAPAEAKFACCVITAEPAPNTPS